MMISLIVAMGQSRQIGKDNKLLWHISEDLKNFKKLTMGKTILMGRKTFESIGFALPGRQTLVLTRDKNWTHKNTVSINSIDEVMAYAEGKKLEELQIVGGEHIYKEMLPLASKIYLSLVDFDGEADTFFPDHSVLGFEEESRIHYQSTEKSLAWDYIELVKS